LRGKPLTLKALKMLVNIKNAKPEPVRFEEINEGKLFIFDGKIYIKIPQMIEFKYDIGNSFAENVDTLKRSARWNAISLRDNQLSSLNNSTMVHRARQTQAAEFAYES